MRANWRECALGDLARIKHGYAFKGEFFGSAGTHVVLTPGNFHEAGGFKERSDKAKWYSGPVPEEYVLAAGDLIVAMTEQGEGLLGSTALVPRPGFYLHNQRLGLVTPSSSAAADRGFLYYLFNCRSVRQQIRASANGAKIRHTSPTRIYEVKVRVPDIATQRRIASILSAYDDLIENNTRRIAILEEMARRIYEEWFVRFRFPGHEGVRMVDSELGLVPEGWEVAALGRLAEVNARSVRRGAEPAEIRYVDISSVSTGSIDNKEPMPFADAPGRARRIVRDGDVIWACVRPNRKSYARVVDPEPNLLVSTGFAVLSPVAAPSSFIYQCVTTDDFVSHLVNHAKGAAYPAVGAEDFANAKVLKPTNDPVAAFDRIAEPMMRLVAALQVKNANLRTTRNLLLPKLISGELDVSAIPEPEALAA
jgi:type I restriction enzyme S subunit